MSAELLEIQPRELKFIFELKKQCTCSVRLINKSVYHVAFKVKTTSPKKYSVRPNIGIVKPKSTCDFTVMMQAQKLAPPDMICKDKFLVQSTIVPAGTTDEDINPSMFAKDDGRYVEENKLRVVLISPPNSPVLSPINGTLKAVPAYEASTLKAQVVKKVESLIPRQAVIGDVDESKVKSIAGVKPEKDLMHGAMKEVEQPANHVEYNTMKEVDEPSKDLEDKTVKQVEVLAKHVDHNTAKKVEEPSKVVEYKRMKEVEEPPKDVAYKTMNPVQEPSKDVEYKTMNEVEEPAKEVEYRTMKSVEELKLVEDIEEMKSKLNELESKLSEAEVTISKLTEERKLTAQERETLQQELAFFRSKGSARKVQVGFPLLFVCMVALVSIMLGYLLHS